MTHRSCSIDGCDRPAKYAKTGWCQTHYHRWYRHGDPTFVGCNERRDMVKYRQAHWRVAKDRGPASDYVCRCGVAAQQWAYDGSDPAPENDLILHKYPVQYSLDVNRYEPLCTSCHSAQDAAARAARRRWRQNA